MPVADKWMTVDELQSSAPGNVIIRINSENIVEFRPDGTIWLNPSLKPDEAARQFLECLVFMWPKYARKPMSSNCTCGKPIETEWQYCPWCGSP